MILLTGASGFVGKNLHQLLLQEGNEVYTISRSDSTMLGEKVDLTCISDLNLIPWSKITQIIHLGAAGVKSNKREWQNCVEVNIGATLNLLSYAQKYNLRLIVGKTFYEDYLDCQPSLKANPYILTKKMGSQILKHYAQVCPVTLVNIFQCYGAGDDDNNVLNYATRALVFGEKAKFGPCTAERDWIHVNDVARLFYLIAMSEQKSSFAEYDAGTGNTITIKGVIDNICSGLQKSSNNLIFGESDVRGDQEIHAKAENFFPQWKPEVCLDDGIKELINYYKVNE